MEKQNAEKSGVQSEATKSLVELDKIESQNTAESTADLFTASFMATTMQTAKSNMISQLEFYNTEEGKVEHEKAVEMEKRKQLIEAAEEMEWLADVARDGQMNFGNGYAYALMDAQSPMGKLPKGLPELPKDPTKRAAFIQTLPVDAGMYSTMLHLKNDPSEYLEIAKEKYKGVLASLGADKLTKDLDFFKLQKPQAMIQTEEKVEESKQKSIEVIKASPKEFKVALKAWEKMVPQAASLLLQTESAENYEEAKANFMQAKDLASKAQTLHQQVFESVEKAANKEKLMSVAQNRITSLLMRQSEAALADFDSLEGCTGEAKDYSGAEARCLCVADNICSKTQQAKDGEYCSVVSSATCMAPKNAKEATEMSTV